jgi:hypothetical protein
LTTEWFGAILRLAHPVECTMATPWQHNYGERILRYCVAIGLFLRADVPY